MRKKFLIKPRYQLQDLFWNLSVVLICFLAGYFLFETIVSDAVKKGPVGVNEWMVLRETLRWGAALVLTLLLAAIGVESYIFSNSVAGPLFALERGMKRLAHGDFQDVTRIRQTDQLKEVIRAFEDLKVKISAKMEAQNTAVQLLTEELDRLLANVTKDNLEAIRSRIKEIREQVEKKAA